MKSARKEYLRNRQGMGVYEISMERVFNTLPPMRTLGFSNSAANKDMMSEIWTNGDTII